MFSLTLVCRNVLRNKRRSVVTVLAIGLSCAGLVLFGGYVAWAHLGDETHVVNMSGHLQLYQKSYLAKGAGNPAAYSIANFDEVKKLLEADEVIGPRLQMATGQLLVQGMINSSEHQTSTSFMGIGAVPEDLDHLSLWNPHGLSDARDLKANAALFAAGPELDSKDPEGISLGVGLGHILEIEKDKIGIGEKRPTVELISQPPGGGMANMLTLTVRNLSVRPLEELDNRLVYIPLPQASNLLFPGEPVHVTSIVLLLKDTRDLPLVENRLKKLEEQGKLPLEWRNCWDLNPNEVRAVRMMDIFFGFAFCIVAVVLVFTIYNTMMMTVMERVREIGTIRTLGLTRVQVVRMFMMEAVVLGATGGLVGELLALLVSGIIDRVEILYIPPMVSMYAKLEVLVASAPNVMAAGFFGCLLVTLAGAYFPARRASRMEITAALRS